MQQRNGNIENGGKNSSSSRSKERIQMSPRRKSFSPLRTRRSGFLILDKQFHFIPCRVQGQPHLLEAALGTCCLFVFSIHMLFPLLAEGIPEQ